MTYHVSQSEVQPTITNSKFKTTADFSSLADRCKNCGIYGKSTKCGTKIENYLLNSISYGPTWDLSHNCNYNGLLHFKYGNEAG